MSRMDCCDQSIAPSYVCRSVPLTVLRLVPPLLDIDSFE
jgi:hypothetical protein